MSHPLKSWKWWLTQVVAWCFGGLFLWAGWLKVQDPGMFLLNIRGYQLLPDPFAAWLALTLPWLEILAGAAVFSGWFWRGGLLLLNALLVVFAAVLIISMIRGLDVECGCFGGAGGNATIVEALIRDFVLLAAGGWLWFQKRF